MFVYNSNQGSTAQRQTGASRIRGQEMKMRKMKKVLGNPAREILNKLFSKDTSKAVRIALYIDGKETKFSVFYQQADGFPQKVIDVTDGVGSGPASSWSDALKLAREFAKLRPAQ